MLAYQALRSLAAIDQISGGDDEIRCKSVEMRNERPGYAADHLLTLFRPPTDIRWPEHQALLCQSLARLSLPADVMPLLFVHFVSVLADSAATQAFPSGLH